jgi:Fe2+ transport system protein B
MATYVPCIAAFTVMVKEFFLKDALKVTTGLIILSFAP